MCCFCKQKTAYEMRMSDWSSDGCSSDLGRSVVMIVSDGYDTGAPELLAREMAALRRRTKRIVWLNPMIGWEGYEPAAGGMQAALPYVDLFAPAHNLKDLEALDRKSGVAGQDVSVRVEIGGGRHLKK